MDMYSASVSVVPVAPRINVAELIRQTSIESGWEGSLLGGGVLNATQASKALCGLSQEVDRYDVIFFTFKKEYPQNHTCNIHFLKTLVMSKSSRKVPV